AALQRVSRGRIPADHQGLRDHDPRRHGQSRGRARGEPRHRRHGVARRDGHSLGVAERGRLRRDDRRPPRPAPGTAWPSVRPMRRLIFGVALAALVLTPVLRPNPFVLGIATQAMIWALLASSWDLLSGYTGQISFGHAGFFALGAYTAAAATKHLGLSPWLGLLAGAGVAALVGLGAGFPALRLRGHYLALVTLALAELIRLLAQNWLAVPGGPSGIYDFGGFPGLPATGIVRAQLVYLLVVGIAAAGVGAMLCVCRLTSAGRAFRAIREDEILAQSLGIDTTVYKLLAFALSSGLAGLAGTLYAYYVQLVSPNVASAATTSLVIGMAVFGG